MRPSFSATVRRLLQQAWPILVGQWASMAYAVMDTAMTGHASAQDLAAMALGVSIYITIFVTLMGVVHALIPILAQRYGAGKMREIGHAWGQGVWMALGLSVLGAVAMLFPNLWLSLSGEVDPGVRARVSSYLLALVFALPAALVFRTVYALGTAVSRPKVVMFINLSAVGVKALANWVLIFGKFGLPALGAVGAGLATAIAYWFSLALAVWVLRHDRYYAKFALRITRPDPTMLRELLRLGLPMGGSYLIEVGAFTFMALLVAREGLFVTGGQQIMANLAALSYTMPMAISLASSAQAAQSLGAGRRDDARLVGTTGFVMVLTGALTTAAVLYLARHPIVALYTNDPDVAVVALALMPLLPLFHVVDALQTLSAYLLRAYKVALLPMLAQAIALAGLGLLGGWWLAFGPAAGALDGLVGAVLPSAPAGAATMWIMAMFGLGLAAVLLHWVYRRVSRDML